MKKIAFIGVGVMGKAMVQNLSQAGYPVSIYTRNKNNVKNYKNNLKLHRYYLDII